MLCSDRINEKKYFTGMINVSSRLPSNLGEIGTKVSLKGNNIKKAFVLWFSQTGNTEKKGKEIAKILSKKGISVSSGEIRETMIEDVAGSDLLIIGSPVFYYDIPSYLKNYIKILPDLNGMAVAGYVTYGGEKGNQHNALCTVLEGLTDKNGFPVAMESFRSKNSFSLKNLFDDGDLCGDSKINDFVFSIIGEIEKGKSLKFRKTLTLKESKVTDGPFWWTKNFLTDHRIDPEKCVGCGKCVEKCPADAIDLESYTINHKNCTLCLGCVNNCREGAVVMEYNGKKITGLTSKR